MLPGSFKKEVADFIDFLMQKAKKEPVTKVRQAGLAKGLIKMKDNFDDPIEGFKAYM